VKSHLPVIVGFGGYNAAGRSSFHHGFRRTVLQSLPATERQETLAGLAAMMKLVSHSDGRYCCTSSGEPLDLAAIEQRYAPQILADTLVRRIEKRYFDVNAVPWQTPISLSGEGDEPICFITRRRQLPEPLPTGWQVEPLADGHQVRVTLSEAALFQSTSFRELPVKSAGQLPSGFEPAELYHSRFHPRGLQLAIVGATDALRSMGIDWSAVLQKVSPEQIAVFSGSIMSQLDENGFGGMLQARLKGTRVTAKQCPLGLNSMPTDFINAYVLGSVGSSGSVTGACATFLYNLQKGIEHINSGRARVVLVGNSEAPITPECIEGYNAMGALATEEGLRRVQGTEEVDFRRASRPFGENCGFTLAESSQYLILMDDALALELGAEIYGAATDVFIHADGFKKSISAPGPGNLLTLARAVQSASQIVGIEGVRKRSFVQAHGSSTPANRVTESHLINRVAQTFGIERWPLVAVKAYLGHSLAAASADQMVSALGSFAYGLLPGIKTIDKLADDLYRSHLDIALNDREYKTDVCFINSKGFGGNNATGVVLSPDATKKMLHKRHGSAAFNTWQKRLETTREQAAAYDKRALGGQFDIIYNFGQDLIDEQAIELTEQGIKIPGYPLPIGYTKDPRFSDMLD